MTDIFENSLYTTQAEKDALVAQKALLMDALLINFFGFLGLYKLSATRGTMKSYETTEGKLMLANIDDTNHDVSLAIKLAHDANILPLTAVTPMTRLLSLIKQKKVMSADLKEDAVRSLLKLVPYASHPPSSQVKHIADMFANGTYSLAYVAKAFYALTKTSKALLPITTEFRALVMKGTYTDFFGKLQPGTPTTLAAIATAAATPAVTGTPPAGTALPGTPSSSAVAAVTHPTPVPASTSAGHGTGALLVPRFENTNPPSNKFWGCAVFGNVLVSHYGPIGQVGTRNEKVFASNAVAMDAKSKLISEKLGKGYVSNGTMTIMPPSSASAPPQAAIHPVNPAGSTVATPAPTLYGGPQVKAVVSTPTIKTFDPALFFADLMKHGTDQIEFDAVFKKYGKAKSTIKLSDFTQHSQAKDFPLSWTPVTDAARVKLPWGSTLPAGAFRDFDAMPLVKWARTLTGYPELIERMVGAWNANAFHECITKFRFDILLAYETCDQRADISQNQRWGRMHVENVVAKNTDDVKKSLSVAIHHMLESSKDVNEFSGFVTRMYNKLVRLGLSSALSPERTVTYDLPTIPDGNSLRLFAGMIRAYKLGKIDFKHSRMADSVVTYPKYLGAYIAGLLTKDDVVYNSMKNTIVISQDAFDAMEKDNPDLAREYSSVANTGFGNIKVDASPTFKIEGAVKKMVNLFSNGVLKNDKSYFAVYSDRTELIDFYMNADGPKLQAFKNELTKPGSDIVMSIAHVLPLLKELIPQYIERPQDLLHGFPGMPEPAVKAALVSIGHDVISVFGAWVDGLVADSWKAAEQQREALKVLKEAQSVIPIALFDHILESVVGLRTRHGNSEKLSANLTDEPGLSDWLVPMHLSDKAFYGLTREMDAELNILKTAKLINVEFDFSRLKLTENEAKDVIIQISTLVMHDPVYQLPTPTMKSLYAVLKPFIDKLLVEFATKTAATGNYLLYMVDKPVIVMGPLIAFMEGSAGEDQFSKAVEDQRTLSKECTFVNAALYKAQASANQSNVLSVIRDISKTWYDRLMATVAGSAYIDPSFVNEKLNMLNDDEYIEGLKDGSVSAMVDGTGASQDLLNSLMKKTDTVAEKLTPKSAMALIKMLQGMFALRKIIDKPAKVEAIRQLAEIMMKLHAVKPNNADYIFGLTEGELKRGMLDQATGAAMLTDLDNTLYGTAALVKPLMKLTPERITELLRYNNVGAGFDAINANSKAGTSITVLNRVVQKYATTLTAPKVEREPLQIAATDQKEYLERKSVEYAAFQNYRHGDIALNFIDEFNVTLAGQRTAYDAWVKKHPSTKIMNMVFHGTGSVAASMILRFGFAVISAGDPLATGRMLGDGIYFSNVIDKATQYIGDSGFSRQIGLRGYILQCHAALGKENTDYQCAGTDNNMTHIRSPEWCVRNKDQMVIDKAFFVELITKKDMEALQRKHRTKNESDGSITQMKTFSQFLRESEEPGMHTTTYSFIDGFVPISATERVEYTELDMSLLKSNVHMEPSAYGPMFIIDHNDGETTGFVVPSTSEFMRNREGLATWLGLVFKPTPEVATA